MSNTTDRVVSTDKLTAAIKTLSKEVRGFRLTENLTVFQVLELYRDHEFAKSFVSDDDSFESGE